MGKERNSNFELMRITSMLLIILCHIINFGGLYTNCSNPALKVIFEILMFMTLVHVNSFVMVSGYFQSKSKFKLSKLIKMIFQVIFYSSIIFFVAYKIGWIKDINVVTILNNFIPSAISNYWFINVYIIMYLFSDYINMFIDRLSHDEYKKMLIMCFIILSLVPYITGLKILHSTGSSFFNFIYLYMIGAYLRRYPLKESYHFKVFSLNGYRLFMIFIFFLSFFGNYLFNNFAMQIGGFSNSFAEISTRILATKFLYSTPFVIIQTIAYFELFNTLELKNKFINLISISTFGVYLFHENTIIREHLYDILHLTYKYIISYAGMGWVLCGVFIIFMFGTIIEWIRIFFEKVILKIPLTKKIILKLKKYLRSFNYRINI